MTKKGFYHCFPRRFKNGDLEIEKGLSILNSICEMGLLLTPEIVTFSHPHSDGTPPRKEEIMQQRICFTELAQEELSNHCSNFGNFAIEYDVTQIKIMGAIPVFYIPKSTSNELASPLASILLIQFRDACTLIDRMNIVNSSFKKGIKEKIPLNLNYTENPTAKATFELDRIETIRSITALSHGLTPIEILSNSLKGMLNFFYPADDIKHNSELSYYRQNEWKIAGLVSIEGKPQMHSLNEDQKKKLIIIDNSFFSQNLSLYSDKIIFLDKCLLFPKVGNDHVLTKAKRIIVPIGAKKRTEKILSVLNNPPIVVEHNY